MRVTMNKDTYGYELTKRMFDEGLRIDVFLDGVEQDMVETADEEAGYVIRYVLDHEGNAQIDPNNRDEVLVERVEGKVEIRVSRREPA